MTATKTRRLPAVKRLTRTAPPTGAGKVRKRVFTGAEVAHRWAANDVPMGRAGNESFEGGCFFSYATVIARHAVGKAGNRFVLLTTRRCSNTTSGHQAGVRQAMRGRGEPLFEVANVLADTVADHRASLTDYADRVAELHRKANKARKYGSMLLAEAVSLVREANAYAEAVGLAERLDESDLEAVAASAASRKALAEKEKTAADRKRERDYRAREAKRVAEWEQKLAAWEDGGPSPGYCPDSSHPLSGVASLRLRAKNTIIETSMGVAVPVEKALPLLELVRSGNRYARLSLVNQFPAGTVNPMPGISLDGYDVDLIDPVGRTVKAGCHRITFDAIEEIAAKLGK